MSMIELLIFQQKGYRSFYKKGYRSSLHSYTSPCACTHMCIHIYTCVSTKIRTEILIYGAMLVLKVRNTVVPIISLRYFHRIFFVQIKMLISPSSSSPSST